MITEATTQVWVRVDLKSKRVISVSDEPLTSLEGKPVFTVSANFARLDYYAVVDNASATYGITVRAKTAEERAAADAALAANVTAVTARAKDAKAEQIRSFYMTMFQAKAKAKGFSCCEELIAAATYAGTDTNMTTNVKPLAVSVLDARNEWRFNVCQPVIDAMYAAADMGVELSNEYRVETEKVLATFMTEKGL